MNIRTRWLFGGLALAAVVLLGVAFAPRPIEVETGRVDSGPFEATIEEDARTRLADRYVVSAPLAGRLERIRLREGDAVAAGDAVATLLPALSPLLDERSTKEAAARADAAQAQLQRAATRVARAGVGREQVRVELQRSEQLARDGFIAPTKLDADRLALSAAQQELDAAVQERHIAEHELEQARAVLGAVRAGGGAQRAFAVRSPIAGQVLRVLQASESTVPLGGPLLEIGDLSRLEVVAELLTADALRTPPGTAVRVERWGGPQTLQGRVARVEPAAFTKVSALGVEEQRVNVIIELTSPREQWRALGDGFRVGVRLVVLQAPKVLRVPTSAVFPRAGGEGHAVFVIDGSRARLQAVTLKARNDTQAWVEQGLAEGAQVIVYPPPAVRDGVRVQERTTRSSP